jgi:hypothetical protein
MKKRNSTPQYRWPKDIDPEKKRFFEAVQHAMPAAVRRARKIARMYGTPIILWENGKVVAKKP